MPKTEYTQDDYVRALLRSAISTANNRLESILNKHLQGSVVVKDDRNGGVYIDYRDTNYGQAFDKTYSCLNNKFFYSTQNDPGAVFIAQAFTILSRGKKLGEQLNDYSRNCGPSINLDFDLLSIVMHYNEKYNEGVRNYIKEHRGESGLSYQDLCVKAEKAQPKLKGDDYEKYLVKQGFSDRKLTQAKLFLDVIGKQYSQSRIIDFLDTYTLYHYYLFRDSINKRFMDYLDSTSDAHLRDKQMMFEKIVQQEVKKHCAYTANPDNGFFNRKYMSFAPRRIDSKRAKNLALEVMESTGGAQNLLKALLQSSVNVSVPQGSEIKIEEFGFRPKTKRPLDYLSEKERKKELEGARLLTTVNCGLCHENDYLTLVDNDFYAYSVTPGQNYRKQAVTSKPKTDESNDLKKQLEENAKNQQTWTQMTLFP